MSRPRYYWFNFAQKCVRRYPELLWEDTAPIATTMYGAIKKALEDTQKRADGTGAERLKLIDMVYIKKTHTFEGAALALNISLPTAQRWNSAFIYLVGERAGFMLYPKNNKLM